MNIGDLLSLIDSAKRRVGSTVQDVVANPKLGLLSMYDTANANAKDYNRRMMGLLGDTMSVVPQVSEQGLEGLIGEASNFMPLAGTFAGVGAKTANKAALAKAQELVKQGADPAEVWKTTGWTDQFPDKKWRFEISDKNAYLPWNKDESISNLIENSRFQGPARMGSVMKHPELANAYPEMMEDIHLSAVPFGGRGAFRPPANITLNSGLSVDKALSPLLHESQHAIQQAEGFALGGTPVMGLGMQLPEGWRGLEGQAALLAKQIKQWEGKYTKTLNQVISEAPAEVLERARKLAKTKTIDELKEMAGNADYEAYRRLAGEAEARLTQSRMGLSHAERKARPPWLEFDVPREQQIVHGLLGQLP
jgi:hypothetical protein